MSLLSKLRETLVCLKAGRVTLPYPAQARPVPEKFRGRPIFDAAKCIGCAGCANNCPAREILVVRRVPGDPHPASTSAAAAPTAGAARMSAPRRPSP